jgi:Protein of unknown function (DUF3048)./Flagellar basal body-associated protein FliL.
MKLKTNRTETPASLHIEKRTLSGWISKNRVLVIIIIVAMILMGGGTAAYFLLLNKNPEPAPVATTPDPEPPVEPEPDPVYYSELTGKVVETEEDRYAAVTAIMIENSPDARPQSGLKNSGVVFEAIAEGGITRFLVLYQSEKPKMIGPVRSVRMYYVDWLTPFQASVAHVGGSHEALKLVRNGTYRDIDEFFNTDTYWRATDRWAPHNVYTSFSRIDALNKKKKYTKSEFTGFPRKDEEEVAEASVKTINVTISSSLYNSSYKYNAKNNSWDRSQADAAHRDREDGRISPEVVIVMSVEEKLVQEDGWREQITTIGSGKAYIFQDGKVVEGKWQKTSRKKQLEFLDKNGKSIELNRGQTWITAIPNHGGSVKWK